MGKWWESPYQQVSVQFIRNYQNDTPNPSKTSNENLDDFRDSLILKNMGHVYGAVAARAIINRVSRYAGKSRSEILSNYETFSKTIIQVYGEVEGRKFLDKIPVTISKSNFVTY